MRDRPASREVYGRKMTAQKIVRGAHIVVPESGRQLIAVLEKNAPRNLSKKASQ
jgi:lipid-binding SYLF domain-containing protein